MTVEEVMNKTNLGLDIFKYYIATDFRINKAFLSPLRKEANPSFNIFRGDNGIYLYKDFGTDETGNAIDFVMHLRHCDFKQALNGIIGDLQLDTNVIVEKRLYPKVKKTASLEKPPEQLRELEEFEFEYWVERGVDIKTLERYNVKTLQSSRSGSIKFAYSFDWGYKVYMPFAKKDRFFRAGSCPENYVFGYEQLVNGMYVVICAGEKDTLCLAARGAQAICMNSETTAIDKDLIDRLTRRFSLLFICYDQDETGKKAMITQCSEHKKLIPVQLPLSGEKSSKDVSDYFLKGHTIEDFRRLIISSLRDKHSDSIKELADNKFYYHKDVGPPQPIVRIGDSTILSVGNIAVVAGPPKAGKSALTYSLISGAITPSPEVNRSKLGLDVVTNSSAKAVLHFDTEQSEYDHQTRVKRSILNAGYKDDVGFFHSYSLLEFDPKRRLDYIEKLVEFHAFLSNGIFLVIIDGIADLITTLNDEEPAFDLVNRLHRLATTYQCGIVCVLHLNPGSMKTRGHLGSQVERKSESLIRLETEGKIHRIVPQFCRNAGFNDIQYPQFTWDDEHRGFKQIGFADPTSVKKKESKEDKCRKYFETASEISQTWTKKDLQVHIEKHHGIKDSAGYEAIKKMISMSMLIEDDSKNLKINQDY